MFGLRELHQENALLQRGALKTRAKSPLPHGHGSFALILLSGESEPRP